MAKKKSEATEISEQVLMITDEERDAFLKKIEELENTSPGKKIAVILHDSPDPDASGCGMALQRYFTNTRKRATETDIFAAGTSSHPQNAAIANALKMEIKDTKILSDKTHREQYGWIIFCDTGKTHVSVPADTEIEPDIIIDHHVDDAEKLPNGCLVIRKDTGAASTIVYRLLKSPNDSELDKDVAMALLLGINIDTNYLQTATALDEQVHDELISGLNSREWRIFVRLCFKYDNTRAHIKLMGRACSFVEYDDLLPLALVGLGETSSGVDNYYGTIADYIFRDPATRLVVIIGIRDGDFIKVSVRTDLETINMDRLFKEVFELESDTDRGRATGGFRNRFAGGALIPFSNREKEEWAVASEEEKKVLFEVKMRRYKREIKRVFNS